ncbi:hypothetical protein KCU71_g7677, partial [Aureobasidium melanogenum]
MSAPGDAPFELQYRSTFPSLPCPIPFNPKDPSYWNYLAPRKLFHSFPVLPKYANISFEEQRLKDMSSPSPVVTEKVGKFSPNALKSFKAAYPCHETARNDDSDLIEPSLPIVIIRVGKAENTTAFAIHKNILEYCSLFFKSMWRSEWGPSSMYQFRPQEDSIWSETVSDKGQISGTRTGSVIEISLDADVAAFRLYTEWVYSGQTQKAALRMSAEDADFSSIGQAYILGEKLQDQKFKNAIVNLLLQTIPTHGKMDLTLPTLVFNQTSTSAPLRKLLVNLYVWYGHKDWLKPDGCKETISVTFLSDLSTAFFDRHDHYGVPGTNILTLNACNYHEHTDGKICSSGIRHPREIVEPESEP